MSNLLNSKGFDLVERYSAQLNDETRSEIKALFLSITYSERQGFFISLPKALSWMGAFDEKTTETQKIDMIDNVYNHFYIKNHAYQFKEGEDYVIRKDPKNLRRKICFLSDFAFKYLSAITPYPKSMAVRMYYIQLEKDYVTALLATETENKKVYDSHQRFVTDFQQYKKDMWYWEGETQYAQTKLTTINKDVKRLEQEKVHSEISNDLAQAQILKLKQEKKFHKEQLIREGNHQARLHALVKRHLIPIYVSYFDPVQVNTLPEDEVRRLRDLRGNQPERVYKMEKYMPRARVLELGLQTESEDEIDQQDANYGKIWEKGITFDMKLKPTSDMVAYYQITKKKVENHVKKLYIIDPRKRISSAPLTMPVIKPSNSIISTAESDGLTDGIVMADAIDVSTVEPDNSSNGFSTKSRSRTKLPDRTINYLDKLIEFLNSNPTYETPIKNVWKTSLGVIEKFVKQAVIDDFSNPTFNEQVDHEYNQYIGFF